MKCKTCQIDYSITEREKEILSKFGFKTREQCSFCIFQQIGAFWPSIGKRYKRKCDYSGEILITTYPSNARFPIYKANYFEGDSWTPVTIDYDSSRKLFDQLKELQEKMPRPHMLGINNENCDYCDDSRNCKDCFLSISQLDCEKLFYSYRNVRCNHSVDIAYSFDCQNCYDLLEGKNCYKVFFSQNATNCSNSYFLYDCRNCKDCFMCWNLRDQKYCIRNKQYTKEDYQKELNNINLGSRSVLEKLKIEYKNHIKNDVYHPSNQNINCDKCDGNYILNSRNMNNCFFMQESEGCINNFRGLRNKNVLSSIGVLDCENSYGCLGTEFYNSNFCYWGTTCRDSEYLDNCQNCSNCFACVGLKYKEYCILNKQYTKEKYFELIEQIKNKMKLDGEYGSPLPYSMMYNGYNTTIARFYFPKTKQEVLELGGYREDEVISKSSFEGFKIPDNIKDITEDIDQKTIICSQTGQAFNFAKQVIRFHKKHNIALPDITHLQRTIGRFKPLTNITSFGGVCSETGEAIIHYYPKEWGYQNIVSRDWYDKNIDG